MAPTSRRWLLAAPVLVLALAVAVGVGMPVAHADSNVDEGQFVAAINVVRVRNGLAPLATDGQLINVARAWSAQMAGDNALSHNPNLATQISNWRTVGENVGTGQSVDSIEAAFEASPHHYANMVDPSYNYVGIGIVEVGPTIWVTEDYKQSKSAVPTVAVPKAAPPPAPPRQTPTRAARPATAPAAGTASSNAAVAPAAVAAVHTTDPGGTAAPATPTPSTPPTPSGSASSATGSGRALHAGALAAASKDVGVAAPLIAALCLCGALAAGAVTMARRQHPPAAAA